MKILKKIAKKAYMLNKFNSLVEKGVSVTGNSQTPAKFENVSDLVGSHFAKYSNIDHACRGTLSQALEKLSNKPAVILETGSSAWGTNSSLLFDGYINSFGGQFESVDLRIEPLINLRNLCASNTTLHCDDSVSWLNKWSANNKGVKIDLLYLDSWDVDWISPAPSGLHGLAEFLAVSEHLKSGSLLLIDDTPMDESFFIAQDLYKKSFADYFAKKGFYPGKGSLVKQLLLSLDRGRELDHQYQLLWEF